MKTKKTVQKFSRDVDAGLHHLEPAQWKGSPEYLELLELSRVMAGQDFSEASHKQAVLGRVRNKTYNQQEEKIMKMNAKLRRPVIILVSLLVAGVLSISIVKPSFAQELLDRALNKINLGNIIASQMDPDQAPPFPEAWKGKLYDKNGNKIEDYTKKLGEVYNAEGEQIVNFDGDKLITKSEQEQRDKEAAANRQIVKDPAELDRYALFTVKLPKYLPEGVAFDHGEFSKGEQGVNGKYLDLIFTSEKIGQKLSMQFRYSDEETAYEMSTSGKMEKVQVNGADAVMMDDRSLHWEADGVLYAMNTRGLERSEVLKIAESIR
ncbi:DUF4367 domain-containing protein [Paenibacillus jilunlii]|uniref:DUF4367 domain-containing protein n=1 Tax=Paenibacillus jilunlii TaxID=682956 RepID=A0A1G9XTK9_9BACL|nr:DUF4367 domain-containing protein [Paenibacillus jilunlii]KWX79739.1 hypothetical protein AML91_02260 [Paenibacillus jilunlii]SDN00137.1 protein of unknown function [Paenibacillus jilunlii]